MSDTQIPALDHTVQQTNVWLKKLTEDHHLGDRHHAYSALRAVLHVLRDRLTPEQAMHLGAQLPILVRGIYYEGWRLAAKPTDERQANEFAALVAAQLPPQFPQDALSVTKAVFDLLWKEPSVPMMLRQSPAGSLPLRAEVETSHGYAPYH
jgi:uncharacterized protein (DUF2267 family)